jgi:exopolysaccharide biosynthesis polyprenyl glycosylphosphotransferase
MLKQQSRKVAAFLYAADLTSALAALAVAYWVRGALLPRVLPKVFPTGLFEFSFYLTLGGPIVVIWTALLFASGAYRSKRTAGLKDEIALITRVAVTGSVLLTLVVFGARWDFISRPFLLMFLAVNVVFTVSVRLLVRLLARRVRAAGLNYRTVVLVGDTQRARSMARLIHEHAWWGFRILGVVREHPADPPGVASADLPVLGTLEEFPSILAANPVDEVILTVDKGELEKLEDVFLLCEKMGVRTRLVLDFFPHVFAHVSLEEFQGTPLLTFSTVPGDDLALLVKRGLDISLAILLGAIYSVPVAVSAALIRLSSKGPAFFQQTRCGLNGRPFTLFKLRTMVDGADEKLSEVAHLNDHDGPVFKAKEDPRVTPLGRFIRRFSLDEAPQFWNVLKGEMSLVGPRPPTPEELLQYQEWQRRRLSMKPGVTGLWQVSGRNDIRDFDEWMELDLAYIDNWSLGLDLKILARTIPAVLVGRGAR